MELLTVEEYKIMIIIKYTIKNTSTDTIYWICFEDSNPMLYGTVGPNQVFDTKYETVEEYTSLTEWEDRLKELGIEFPEGTQE